MKTRPDTHTPNRRKRMTLSSNPQPSRRRFLGSLALGGAALALGSRSLHATSRELSRITGAGPVTLPPLPYKEDALDPVISARTIGFHYGKHHAGYVRKLNAVIRDTDWEEWSLEKIVTESHKKMDKDAKMRGVFNNAAQIWTTRSTGRACAPPGVASPKARSWRRSKRASAAGALPGAVPADGRRAVR
jgi:Fe-Mn family superoxide dismutase